MLLFFSCSKKNEVQQLDTSNVSVQPKEISVPKGDENHEGLKLIEASDCLSCHKTAEKFVGPSYAEIAEKYTNNDTELLAKKIVEGGSGVWGEVPMQPHPQITKEEAVKMVEYIMTLKK